MSTPTPGREPRPDFLKVRLRVGPNFTNVRGVISDLGLHTVCQEARCPNIYECWQDRAATFLILGAICTRNCAYCAVQSGRPAPADLDEPRRVAEAVAAFGLEYVVVTSVTRDDLADGGAAIFADTIRAIRARVPGCRVEVLVPDFAGNMAAVDVVMAAQPDVFNHNIETVQRLFRVARPKGSYERSLDVLSHAARWRPSGGSGDGTGMVPVKSGFMVGLGESDEEIAAVLADLRQAGVTSVTIGQYLQPTRRHLPVTKYYTPAEFDRLRELALGMGFAHVEAGPLVRSSYHARRQFYHTAAADGHPSDDLATAMPVGGEILAVPRQNDDTHGESEP